MISAADTCGQVVGGNYDVVLTADTSDSNIDTDQSQEQHYLSQKPLTQQNHQHMMEKQHLSEQQPQQPVLASDHNHNIMNCQELPVNGNHYHNKPMEHSDPRDQQQQHQQQHLQNQHEQQSSRHSSSPSASSSAGSAVPHFGRALTNYLERFEQLELELEQAIHAGLVANCGYANEFRLLKEFSKQLRQNKENLREGEMDINQIKNRYKDIIPFSHTRVSLLGDSHIPGSDYINANYIRGASGSPQAYIACQGPLPGTLMDFWRMIWECRVSVLVMACNEFESGRSKCEIYWPHELNSSVNYGPFQIRLLRVRQICQDFLVRKFSIKLLKQEPPMNQSHPLMNQAEPNFSSYQQAHQKPQHVNRSTNNLAGSASASSQSSSISSVSSTLSAATINSTNCFQRSEQPTQLQNNNHLRHQKQVIQPNANGYVNGDGQFLRPTDMTHQQVVGINGGIMNSKSTSPQTTSRTSPSHSDCLKIENNNNLNESNINCTNSNSHALQYQPQHNCHQIHPSNPSHGISYNSNNNLEANINLNLNIDSDNNSAKMKISPIQQQQTPQVAPMLATAVGSSTTNIASQSFINDNNNLEAQPMNANHNTTSRTSVNLQTMEEGETRIICQFHYTTWPDHGAPRSMQPILEMVRLMREVQPAEDRPILVHCSAGCGRTGTICCIDYVWGLLRRGELDPSFDLCSIISEMRQQRMAMVQTLEQYILCHRAVAALFIDQLKLIDDHTYENLDDLGPLDAVEAANRAEPSTVAGSGVNVRISSIEHHFQQNLHSYNDDNNFLYDDDEQDDSNHLMSEDERVFI